MNLPIKPAAAALSLAFTLAFAGPVAASCEVVTDASLDMLPQLDIVSASLFKDGGSIGATIEVTDLNLPSVDADYLVHWVDQTGAGYFIAVGVLVDAAQGAIGEHTADIGTYDPATGIYTWNADAEGVSSVEGNTLTVLVDESWVGYPSGTLTGIGAVTTEYFTGLYPANYDSTDNDGEWRVGDSCGKSEPAVDPELLAAVPRAAAGAGGSLGWLGLLLVLPLLSRRR